MSFTIPNKIVEGLKVVVALENDSSMPSVEDVVFELEHLAQQVEHTEKFYGVPFRAKQREFRAIDDVRVNLTEFYFGDSTRSYHLYRCRPMFRLVIEPILDSLSTATHDEVLDNIRAIVEQLKEKAFIFRKTNTLNVTHANVCYRRMVDESVKEKKIATIVEGVMKLRRKSAALYKQMRR